jgi:hypothetical protein
VSVVLRPHAATAIGRRPRTHPLDDDALAAERAMTDASTDLVAAQAAAAQPWSFVNLLAPSSTRAVHRS